MQVLEEDKWPHPHHRPMATRKRSNVRSFLLPLMSLAGPQSQEDRPEGGTGEGALGSDGRNHRGLSAPAGSPSGIPPHSPCVDGDPGPDVLSAQIHEGPWTPRRTIHEVHLYLDTLLSPTTPVGLLAAGSRVESIASRAHGVAGPVIWGRDWAE